MIRINECYTIDADKYCYVLYYDDGSVKIGKDGKPRQAVKMEEVKGGEKVVCANVDMYSGLVYKMLKIPEELYTPLFAVSRIVGWSAHRIEEKISGGRIIRPADKAVAKPREYKSLADR